MVRGFGFRAESSEFRGFRVEGLVDRECRGRAQPPPHFLMHLALGDQGWGLAVGAWGLKVGVLGVGFGVWGLRVEGWVVGLGGWG